MKSFLLTVLLAVCAFAAEPDTAVDLSKPIPALRLPDGRILQNAMLSNFTALNVTIRHKAGTAIVRYEALPDEIRTEAEKKRPGGPRIVGGKVAEKTETIKGQVFVTTRGAGAYKFSGVEVYAFPAEALDTWKRSLVEVHLPFPLAKTVTDGDGRFTIAVPADTPYFLFAQAQRLVLNSYERYEWRAPSSEFEEKGNVQLSGDKWRFPQSKVTIDTQPN